MPKQTSTPEPPDPFEFLRQYAGEWVNDTDIIRHAGPTAILALRKLRGEGQPLRARLHPNGEGLQWMYDGEPEPEAEPDREPFPIEVVNGRYQLRELTCYDCGGTYTVPRAAHLTSVEHRAWLANQSPQRQTEVFVEPIIDEQAQPLPTNVTRLEFGQVRICRRCHGKLRAERRARDGTVIPADTICMDPQDPLRPCRACRGTGVQQISR